MKNGQGFDSSTLRQKSDLMLRLPTMATVMWDLDGVACDWVGNFYPWICEKEGWEPTDWETWHHYRTHEMHDDDFVVRLAEYAEEGGFGDQAPNPGFSACVEMLDNLGHTQHVVTDRPAIAEADTAWWLNEYAPQIASLTISRDKTVFKEYGPGPYFAIDDRTENVQKMRDAGIEAYLLTKPWNVDADLPRVNTLTEFVVTVHDRSAALAAV